MLKDVELPSRIVFKEGLVGELEDYLHSSGYQRPLYIVNSYTREHFMPEGVDFFDAVDASIDCANVALSFVGNHDAVVGLGGGKNIDIAKYVGGKAGVPVIAVPTIPSHDGIASPMVSLSGEGRPFSQYFRPPHCVLVDLEVLADAPKKFIISGFGDVIGKYSSIYDWWLAHKDKGEAFDDYLASLVKLSFRHLIRHRRAVAGGNPKGIEALLKALITNGIVMGVQRSSRPASGSEHLISHALGRGIHGLQVGLCTIIAAYLQGRDWRMIKEYLNDVGAPTTAESLGVSPEALIRAVVVARTLRDRYTILHKLKLDESAVKDALKAIEVI